VRLRSCRLVDATDSRTVLRGIAHAKAGDAEPFADPKFSAHLERVSTADERQTRTDRLLRARGAA